jgi:hypothetical protein
MPEPSHGRGFIEINLFVEFRMNGFFLRHSGWLELEQVIEIKQDNSLRPSTSTQQ